MYARRWLCSRVVSLSITTICMVINTLYPWTLIEDQSIRRIARPAIVNDCHLQLISDIIHSADRLQAGSDDITNAVSYTHLRAHETRHDLVCRLLLEKKKE